MQLLSLKLNNFKGIKDLAFEPNGHNAEIAGDNASGKTTVVDAAMWLLFDKDSANSKQFEIKSIDPKTGQTKHNLEHSVEGVFFTDKEIRLKKVYAEKWTKRRGQAKAEFTGHTTDHLIDGVPVSKTEYQNRISEICSEETFRLLTDPRFFNEQLHWQKRREILLNAFGDVTDTEIIEANPKLKALPDIVKNHTLDEYRKIIAARRAQINKELDKIPVRIDEAARALPDVSDLNKFAIEKTVTQLTHDLKAKESEKSRIENGGQVAELQKKLRQEEAELIDAQNQAEKELNARVNEKSKAVSGLLRQSGELESQITALEKQIKINVETIKNKKRRLSELRHSWGKIKAEQMPCPDVNTECPTCGQGLPEDQIKTAVDKATAAFNQNKADMLSENQTLGIAVKKEIDQLTDDSMAFKTQIASLKKDKAGTDTQIENVKAEIKSIEEERPEAGAEPLQITELKERITELKTGSADQLTTIQKDIDFISNQLEENRGMLAEITAHEKGQARIKELEAEEKTLAAEFEKLESELFLTDEFTRARVRVLESRINDKFKIARFKLFETQVNGGLVECCEVIENGVPYSSMNNAARINIGLDIINTLSGIYDFSAPIFIDNAEAVNELFEVENAQMIRLTVAKNKKLKVTVEENKSKAA